MPGVFDFDAGTRPLLVSVPHDGRTLAPGMAERMTDAALGLPDTDWHVAQLYDVVRELGASLLVARYSRYVIDLNRPGDDASLYAGQISTGLCPTGTFAGGPIYRDAMEPAEDETEQRLETYWRPYHAQIADTLATMRERFGYALLWDAHSIASVVPRLFDGVLKPLNLGSNDGMSAAPSIVRAVADAADPSRLVVDGRFKGGHITRHYGRPDTGVHALQLEIAQRAYMDEATLEFDEAKAASLRRDILRMLDAMLASAAALEA